MKHKNLWLFLLGLFSLISLSNFAMAAPSFSDVTSNINTWDNNDLTISKDNTLEENIKSLFYPYHDSPYSYNQIWQVLRIAWVWILIIFLIRAGALFILWAWDEGKVKKARMNFIYILYWAFLFFGATWILWSALNVGRVQGTSELIENFQNEWIFQILAFFKGFAFFVAIVMIAYYWFRIMQAYENEEKIKEWRTGIINVLLALVFIRVIDYLYYIAQAWNFKNDAWNLIINISKVMGYILWILLVISVLYAWTSLVLSKWNPEKRKKAKWAIQTVLIVTVLVFLFLLIIHQVLSDIQVQTLD